MEPTLEKKFLGCIVGSALGDAIGQLAFSFRNKARLRPILATADTLTYTDDTAMMIGLAQSLIENRDVDSEHLGRTFHENFEKEPWRGYASGPPTVFHIVKTYGVPYVIAAQSLFDGRGSSGNGSAMRVAPIGLFFHKSPLLTEKAFVSAEVTHSHIMGKQGAALQAIAIDQVLPLDPEEPFPLQLFIDRLLAINLTPELHEKVGSIRSLLENHVSCVEAIRVLGKTVAIHESLPFSMYAFLKHPESFEESIFCAITNGGDHGYSGAMTGAISGAYLGIDGIAKKWQEKLEIAICCIAMSFEG